MKRIILSAFILCVAAAHGQVNNPSITVVSGAPSGACSGNLPDKQVATLGTLYSCQSGTYGQIGAGGGGGTPGGSTLQGQMNLAGSFAGTPGLTFNSTGLVAQIANVQFLSAASEIGAQCNAAVTALGAAGGAIQLPNSTSLTMSTTCTNIPAGISIHGYGKLATIIKCSVVGDCFQFLQNPTTNGEIGGVISDFAITGSNTGQTSLHFNGASGYTLHDLQFQPYPGVTGDTTAVCLEFDNSATGLFTERNRTYSVYLERTCTIGVLFNKQSAGQPSFGYNTFEFGVVSQGANYALVFNGAGQLYNGSLTVFANHVGPGGGVVQFNNNFNVSGGSGGTLQAEHLYITAEENGSGAGVVLAATGTSSLGFEGAILNGGGGATGLATLTSIAGGANFHLFGDSGVVTTLTGAGSQTSVLSGPLTLGPTTDGLTNGTLNIQPAGSTTPTWNIIANPAANYLYMTQSGNNPVSGFPFAIFGAAYAPSTSSPGAMVESNGSYQFASTTTGNVSDTTLTRSAAGTVQVGHTGSLASGSFSAASYIAGGSTGVTKTCGATIVVTGGIITSC